MATTKERRCAKTRSVIFASKLEADIAIARIEGNLARHWRNRYRETPRKSYPCGSHWHVTKN